MYKSSLFIDCLHTDNWMLRQLSRRRYHKLKHEKIKRRFNILAFRFVCVKIEMLIEPYMKLCSGQICRIAESYGGTEL